MRVNPWPWKPGALVPEWLRLRKELEHQDKIAYGILVVACDEDGTVSGNFRSLLEKRGKFDPQEAVNALASLVKHKLIRVIEGKVHFLAHPWMTGESAHEGR